MTIHQPRESAFRKFDQVFMLQPNGRVLLSGSLPQIRGVLEAHQMQFHLDGEDIQLYMADVVADILADKASMEYDQWLVQSTLRALMAMSSLAGLLWL
jgi:hypothetical protein